MNKIILTYLLFLGLNCSSQTDYHEFTLKYSYSGLGSNMGSLQPVFAVNGMNYEYTNEQNSYYGELSKSPKKICTGVIPEATIDSIINLVRVIEDTLIYRANIGVMSGGIHFIHIKSDTIEIKFTLHNETDPIAQKIIDLLNLCIPKSKPKLWLWKE